MNFTDGKQFTATAEDLRKPWAGSPKNFRCAWCGHIFALGDIVRWVYTNGNRAETKGIHGNPFICIDCDGPEAEILAKLQAKARMMSEPSMWWFRERLG